MLPADCLTDTVNPLVAYGCPTEVNVTMPNIPLYGPDIPARAIEPGTVSATWRITPDE
jgi:hypothetical protein